MAESSASRIGVVAAALSGEVREAVARARTIGFSGLLFDAYSPRLSLPDLSGSGRREFLHVLAGGDQRLIGLRGDLGPKGFGPGADVDRLLARIDRAMEAAAGLRSPLLCLDVGPLPAPPPAPKKPKPAITPEQAGLIILPTSAAGAGPIEAPPEEELPPMASPAQIALTEQVNAALVELGRRADRYSVTVALSSSLAGFASLEQAIRAAACPWMGINLDGDAIVRDNWSADEVFSRLGLLIRHVCVRDAVRGADRRTRPVPAGQGDANWPGLIARLDDSGYTGWLTVDPTELPDRIAAAQRAAALLKQLKLE